MVGRNGVPPRGDRRLTATNKKLGACVSKPYLSSCGLTVYVLQDTPFTVNWPGLAFLRYQYRFPEHMH